MKKALALLLASLLLLSFAACKKGAKQAKVEYTTELVSEEDGIYTNYYDKKHVLHKKVYNCPTGDILNTVCEYSYNDDGTRTETTVTYEDKEYKVPFSKTVLVYDSQDRAIRNEEYEVQDGKYVLTTTSVTKYNADGSSVDTVTGKDAMGYQGDVKIITNADKDGKRLSYKVYSNNVLIEDDNGSVRKQYNAKGTLICTITYSGHSDETGYYKTFTVNDKNGKLIQKDGSYTSPSGEIFETAPKS